MSYLVNPYMVTAPVVPMVCYNDGSLNTYYEYRSTTDSNFVLGAYIDTGANPVYNKAVTSISTFLYADSTLSGGVFALGVWDENGNLRNESSDFTVADMPVGTSPANPTEKITRSIDETTIALRDSIGIICKTAPTGSGDVANGGYDGTFSAWKRSAFIQGDSFTATANRVLVICVNE